MPDAIVRDVHAENQVRGLDIAGNLTARQSYPTGIIT